MSLAHIIWPILRPVLAAAVPNVLVLLVVGANMVWLLRVGPLHHVGAYFTFDETWPMALLTISVVIVIDFAAITLFARRWRAHRWGRKPAEIERATRYLVG